MASAHKKTWDYLIVGAGIIGLTIARELRERFPLAKILLLEKENCLGKHASGRNSGVLHSGIFYPVDTLKAKFCKEGADHMYAYAKEHNIAVHKTGKVIVAVSERNAKGLDDLLKNAKNNQISAEKINSDDIRKLEPLACSEYGGIYCKDTSTIDSPAVLEVLRHELGRKNVEIYFNQTVLGIDEIKQTVKTQDQIYCYGLLINAAGAYADSIAKLVSVGMEYQLIPFKGMYYKFKDEFASRIHASIYPVPDPQLPFLGVHATRSIFGDVYMGPTAIPALGRENYHGFQGITLTDCISISIQLMKLYAKNRQNFRNLVHTEVRRYAKSGFIHSARALMNDLQVDWLQVSSKVGIRPQLLNVKESRLEMDFVLKNGKNSLHVLNSISPAFTSSFAVAQDVVNRLNA